MIIYQPNARNSPKQLMFVQPGNEYPNSEWIDEKGKPRLITVEFKFGKAEVPDNLGQYMLDHDMAKPSPIILLH